MKEILIKQPMGLGDILFCQKLATKLIQLYKSDIIWPVIPEYLYVNSYLNTNFNIESSESTENFQINYIDCTSYIYKKLYKPLFDATPKGSIHWNSDFPQCISLDGCNFSNMGVMQSKYHLTHFNYHNWSDYLKRNLIRNYDRELKLFNEVVGMNVDEEYIVINKNIGSPGHESTWNYNYPTNKKVVELRKLGDYTVFDWCMVLQNASEFHLMETCFCYLIEILDTKEQDYILYHRSPSDSNNFKEFSDIYKKPKKHVGSENISCIFRK